MKREYIQIKNFENPELILEDYYTALGRSEVLSLVKLKYRLNMAISKSELILEKCAERYEDAVYDAAKVFGERWGLKHPFLIRKTIKVGVENCSKFLQDSNATLNDNSIEFLEKSEIQNIEPSQCMLLVDEQIDSIEIISRNGSEYLKNHWFFRVFQKKCLFVLQNFEKQLEMEKARNREILKSEKLVLELLNKISLETKLTDTEIREVFSEYIDVLDIELELPSVKITIILDKRFGFYTKIFQKTFRAKSKRMPNPKLEVNRNKDGYDELVIRSKYRGAFNDLDTMFVREYLEPCFFENISLIEQNQQKGSLVFSILKKGIARLVNIDKVG